MSQIKITFPDSSVKDFKKGTTGLEIAKSISEGLARVALAIKVNGNLQDLSQEIEQDSTVQILTFKDNEGRDIFRHSSAHLLAAAVQKLYPHTKFGHGPAIENGFFYDMDVKITEEDFPKIEAEMKRIVKEKKDYKRVWMKKKEALKHFIKDELKCELIQDKAGENVSVYQIEDTFADFCQGPHIPNTSKIEAFKLTKVAGAYWKADSNNRQLTRVYGTSFPSKKELTDYLTLLEEAEKRDHRKLGKQLDLFSFSEKGPGFVLYHPKGTIIFNELQGFIRQLLQERNYNEIRTPIILDRSLWEASGHWDHYKENMYFTKIDEKDFAVKPMNCPGGTLVYSSSIRSYRDLPLRMAEFGMVHRHELSGVLSGLFRVRSFTQDDAHIYCTVDQIKDEILDIMKLMDLIYKTFDFEYKVELSTRPQKSMGTDEIWDKATSALKEVLDSQKVNYKINPGDGAFYGPKIDFHLKDSLGRTWQCGTIQVDFSMPEKFGLTYEGKDGKKHTPVMVHRAIYGSLERFIGILIEHYAGKFPLWISPEQVRILTVADRFDNYAEKIKKQMKKEGIRATIDQRQESISKKVRDAQIDLVNYILVVGEKEEKDNTVTVRTRNNIVQGPKKTDQFINTLVKEIVERK